jgi:hypothetical protein
MCARVFLCKLFGSFTPSKEFEKVVGVGMRKTQADRLRSAKVAQARDWAAGCEAIARAK